MTIHELEIKLNEAANLIAATSRIFDEVLSEFDCPGVDFDEIQRDLLAMFPDAYGDYADASSFVSAYGELLEEINNSGDRDYDDEDYIAARICAKPAICGEPANSCDECPHYRYDDNHGEKSCFATVDYAKSQTESEAKSE